MTAPAAGIEALRKSCRSEKRPCSQRKIRWLLFAAPCGVFCSPFYSSGSRLERLLFCCPGNEDGWFLRASQSLTWNSPLRTRSWARAQNAPRCLRRFQGPEPRSNCHRALGQGSRVLVPWERSR